MLDAVSYGAYVVVPVGVGLRVVRGLDVRGFDLIPDLGLRLDARFASALSSRSTRAELQSRKVSSLSPGANKGVQYLAGSSLAASDGVCPPVPSHACDHS